MSYYAPFDPDGGSDLPAFDAGKLRPATVDDAAGVARLIADRHGADYDEALARTTRELETTVAEPDRYLMLVAEEGGEIVGFGRARFEEAGRDNEKAPRGWYLMGVVVTPRHHRRGIGHALTQGRLDWIAQRAGGAYYFANRENRTSIALHDAFGFVVHTRNFGYTRADLSDEDGVLYKVDLRA